MKTIRHFLTNTDVDSYIKVITYPNESIHLKLADCDRAANIWFPINTKKRLKHSIKKLNNIIEPLLRMKEYMEKKLQHIEELDEAL